ncbi:MAG: hypothetical protein FWE06_02605 [Oscillospiraceae bacterium]|nr:hypothetical protein [Oscillospiraceae bacterium]
MKKTIFICILSCLFLLAACGTPREPTTEQTPEYQANIPLSDDVISPDGTINFEHVILPEPSTYPAVMLISVAWLGDTWEQYFDASEVVIIAHVNNVDRYGYYEMEGYEDGHYISLPESFPRLTVIDVFKGDLLPGDNILLRQIGYTTEDSHDFGSVQGVPLLREDMVVLLFLNEFSIDTPERLAHISLENMPVFSVVGAYQGAFFFDSSGYMHQSSLFGPEPSTSKDIEELHYADIVALLQEVSLVNAQNNDDEQ